MVFSNWTEHDGYHESISSFQQNTTPLLKLRAVRSSDGKYSCFIRDFSTGHLVSSLIVPTMELERAKERSIELTRKYIQYCLQI